MNPDLEKTYEDVEEAIHLYFFNSVKFSKDKNCLIFKDYKDKEWEIHIKEISE